MHRRVCCCNSYFIGEVMIDSDYKRTIPTNIRDSERLRPKAVEPKYKGVMPFKVWRKAKNDLV